jgi:hypothetical protein
LKFVIAKFPASAAFDQDRQDAIKQGGAVFAFTLKNPAGETESWNLDLKKEGKVSKGLGEKPTGSFNLAFALSP